MTCGPDPRLLTHRMQHAINDALAWGQEHGLSFSPPKTVAVPFTRKRSPEPFPVLHMGATDLPYSDQVKYLGLLLDSKLTWQPHLRWKLRSAKGLLLKIRNSTGKLWGPPPCMARWAYTGIVRPSFLYGAFVWARACTSSVVKARLAGISRLALVSLGHFRRSTPTAGLEVITHTTPLHLSALSEAVSTYMRVSQLHGAPPEPPGPHCSKNHVSYCQDSLAQLGVPVSPVDIQPTTLVADRLFTIDLSSLHTGAPRPADLLAVYTDGSQISGSSGCGFAVYERGAVTDNRLFHLQEASVFQCEVYAIWQAAEWLRTLPVAAPPPVIYTDSQAALKALASTSVSSSYGAPDPAGPQPGQCPPSDHSSLGEGPRGPPRQRVGGLPGQAGGGRSGPRGPRSAGPPLVAREEGPQRPCAPSVEFGMAQPPRLPPDEALVPHHGPSQVEDPPGLPSPGSVSAGPAHHGTQLHAPARIPRDPC